MSVTRFELTSKQEDKLRAWMAKRPKAYAGAIGGRYTFSFMPTGVGTIIVVKDTLKGAEIDLSDYQDW